MKRAGILVFMAILFTAGMAAAVFPPVPETAEPVRVNWFSDEADVYLWMQDENLYIRFDVLTPEFFACSSMYTAFQSDGEGGFRGGIADITREGSSTGICEDIIADETFLVDILGGSSIDFTQPLEFYFGNWAVDSSTVIHVFPVVGSKPAPINGIWRSADGVLSVYIQKYQAQSAVAVATLDGINMVAFLDTDISDGFSVNNDVGSQGYGVSFVFHSNTSATVTVDMPAGTVTKDISLAFQDFR